MNTSSTSLLRTSITAAPRRRARRPMESVSASIAPYWMSSIASRSARRSTAASTSCRLTSMPGWSSTTICGLIKAAGASARPRCRLFLTHYHWRRRNSWLLDHCRQNTLPQTANTACQIKSELIHLLLDPEIPLVALLRLVHLGIARLVGVLGRGRRIDDRRIDDRAGSHLQSLRRQMPL